MCVCLHAASDERRCGTAGARERLDRLPRGQAELQSVSLGAQLNRAMLKIRLLRLAGIPPVSQFRWRNNTRWRYNRKVYNPTALFISYITDSSPIVQIRCTVSLQVTLILKSSQERCMLTPVLFFFFCLAVI